MRKGIRLILKLQLEGEDEPAHDFAASSIQAVREMLETGAPFHPALELTIRSIKEDTDWEDDEENPA